MFQAEPALVYDSVQVFAHGLAALDRSHDLRPANLSCEKEEPWDDGLSLYNYINSVRMLCIDPFRDHLRIHKCVNLINIFRNFLVHRRVEITVVMQHRDEQP